MSADLISMGQQLVYCVFALIVAFIYTVRYLQRRKLGIGDTTSRLILGVVLVSYAISVEQGWWGLWNYFREVGNSEGVAFLEQNAPWLGLVVVPIVIGYTLFLYPWLKPLLPRTWLVASLLVAAIIFSAPVLLVH